MMEENPVAAIENNVFGTVNLVNAALNNNVSRFVLVTTDKAVEPASVYGVSKFLCEKLVLKTAASSAVSNFMVVRFGNVLGSRGSIVPLFQKQIEKGGPLTITHPDMKRWFMTIPEACSLVLKAGGVGANGELYLLDMGEPVRIWDMAEQMIRFNGFTPGVDIKIETIGLRPGEKIDERLWADDEMPVRTKFGRIRRVEKAPGVPEIDIDLDALLTRLAPVCRFDADKPEAYRNSGLLRAILKEAVPTLKMPTASVRCAQ
jgi:FlaA1/EpsC-like NDP-sugar epimerase